MTLKYIDDFDDFDYEVTDDEVLSALGEICYETLPDTFKTPETKSQNELLIESFIETFDLQEKLKNKCYDDLHDHFEIEAREWHRENKEINTNYFRDTGLSEADFIGDK